MRLDIASAEGHIVFSFCIVCGFDFIMSMKDDLEGHQIDVQIGRG